jgi:hypothetical protein
MNSISRSKSKMQTESSSIFKWLFVFMVSIFITEQLSAQVSPRIRTTSNLKDGNGSAVPDGIYNITFRLYSTESGSIALWTELAQVQVRDGLYSHLLGSITPLNTVNFNTTRYLGVQIGDFELTPRTELTYAPYAVAAKEVVCSGAVGDVKYSLLNPSQFALVNGDCWVPLNGASASGSRLSEQFGFGNVPDGSGLFIRAQEFSNSPNNDPDRTSTSQIAQIQTDAVRAHNHTLNYGGGHSHNYNDTDQQNTNYRSYSLAANGNTNIGDDSYNTASKTTSSSTSGISINNNTGSSETRPVNLNVWAYIRIN